MFGGGRGGGGVRGRRKLFEDDLERDIEGRGILEGVCVCVCGEVDLRCGGVLPRCILVS